MMARMSSKSRYLGIIYVNHLTDLHYCANLYAIGLYYVGISKTLGNVKNLPSTTWRKSESNFYSVEQRIQNLIRMLLTILSQIEGQNIFPFTNIT